MKNSFRRLLEVLLFSWIASLSHAKEITIELPLVSSLPIYALESLDSNANVIAIVGGKGIKNKLGKSDNFVSRVRNDLHKVGFNYYLLPNPTSDKNAGYRFRASDKNRLRISHLVNAIKQRNDLPIYLLGFSRGTVDVASYVALNGHTIDGVVLVSAIYDNDVKKASSYSMEKIFDRSYQRRVLLIHHVNDACLVSNTSTINAFYKSLKSKQKMLRFFHGGEGNGRECGPFHYHGFEGIEKQVVKELSLWVNR